MKKRVYIANTGGTIGMKKTPQGYVSAPGYLAEQTAHTKHYLPNCGDFTAR